MSKLFVSFHYSSRSHGRGFKSVILDNTRSPTTDAELDALRKSISTPVLSNVTIIYYRSINDEN